MSFCSMFDVIVLVLYMFVNIVLDLLVDYIYINCDIYVYVFIILFLFFFFFFQAEDGIRDLTVTGVQTCALPILYVLKFRGAGQGTKALIAELIAGELARAAGLLVPELVFVALDPEIAKTEPDPEIQDLIRASGGVNLALDYLPGSVMFDPVAEKPDADLASRIVWFDAYITNVDRTPRNANLLMWHRKLWLIDHGAALYFHHAWTDMDQRSKDPFRLIKEHILLPFASAIETADQTMTATINEEVIKGVVDLIPEDWMNEETRFSTTAENRQAYVDYLTRRLDAPRQFVQEAIRAR